MTDGSKNGRFLQHNAQRMGCKSAADCMGGGRRGWKGPFAWVRDLVHIFITGAFRSACGCAFYFRNFSSLSVCLSVCLFAGRGRCSDWAGYIPDPSVGDATEAVRGAETHIFVGPFLYKTDQFTKTGLVAR